MPAGVTSASLRHGRRQPPNEKGGESAPIHNGGAVELGRLDQKPWRSPPYWRWRLASRGTADVSTSKSKVRRLRARLGQMPA